MIAQVPLRCALMTIALVCGNVAVTSARAQSASPWVDDTHSSVRLLAGPRSGNEVLGGIDLTLAEGWKTYWRNPGDSGVPPRFDFSQSDNVASVTPLFPAPMQFPDGAGGTSFGYRKRVVLPLRIVPKDASRPVTLRASLNYAVCEKICIPVAADAELAFAATAGVPDSELADALKAVPKPAEIGNPGPFAIQHVLRDGNRVLVDVTAPDAAQVSLFAEGPTPEWALPVPKPIDPKSAQKSSADPPPVGTIRFAFDLDGLPSDTRAEGATLKLTLVGGDSAYEYDVKLN
jgi:DsbC/DsbD-like thiol-disulfide interchange protein